VTKWIQLNWGDDGIIRLFTKFYRWVVQVHMCNDIRSMAVLDAELASLQPDMLAAGMHFLHSSYTAATQLPAVQQLSQLGLVMGSKTGRLACEGGVRLTVTWQPVVHNSCCQSTIHRGSQWIEPSTTGLLW
jgi:hypothetical protein